MSRYIDADRLRKDILGLPNCYNGFSDAYDKALIIDRIDEQPAADVRENVRGEWITPTEKMYSMDGEDITFAYKECNRCHKVYVRTNDNFCPNCGADMRDGEADDESRIN